MSAQKVRKIADLRCSVWFALAMVFGNGQSRVKVAGGEVPYVKNLVSDLGQCAAAPASYS